MVLKSGKAPPTADVVLELYGEIERKVSRFNKVWPKHVIQAYAYEIPYYDFTKEDKDLIPPQKISPTQSYEGKIAVTHMQAALSKFTKDGELQHSNNVFKLPSIAIVDSLSDLKPLINDINDAKAALQQTIGVYSPAGRNKFTNRVFPDQVMFQVYRKIHYFDFSVKRLSFTWTGKAIAYKKLTLQKALSYVDNYYSRFNLGLSGLEGDSIKTAIKDEILAHADKDLRLRREVAPKLSLKAVSFNTNLLLNNDARGLKNSSIPMFAAQSESGPIVIPPKTIKVSNNTDIRKKRSSLVPIEPRLGLYWLRKK